MLLSDIKNEFAFHCQCRKLSPRTVKNYTKQIDYLLKFLKDEKGICHIEDVESRQIKEFLLKMDRSGHTPNYVNDLLKAYKVFFRYAFEEGYTRSLLTEKIRNMKKPKIIIRTFSEQELKRIRYAWCRFFLCLRGENHRRESWLPLPSCVPSAWQAVEPSLCCPSLSRSWR